MRGYLVMNARMNNRIAGLLIILALTAAACMSPGAKQDILRDAELAYSEAESYEYTKEYAPMELAEAERTLRQAEGASGERKMRHLAYLAERRAQVAQELAREKATTRDREQLLREQEQILRQLRQAEGEQAQQRLETLRAELQELEARPTERGLILTLGDILFETGKSELVSGSGEKLDKVASVLEKFPDRRVIVEGHTDSRGSYEYNQQLSEARAASVRTALVERGIDPERITSKGLSESRPIADNETAIGRQQNRRVEIVIANT
ncbi:MAG: OmpA family protein [Desulfovibrionales bacterium]